MVVDKISRLVDASPYTAETVEQLAGLPRARISKWKSGLGEPTVSQALRIARLLKVSLESLADDDQDVRDDHDASRLRVVEIAHRIGWEAVWLRLIGAAHEPIGPGVVLGSVDRRSGGKSTGG